MAIKYTPEELKFLKDSPLCTKPDNLPPAEEWMGSPVEQQSARTQNQTNRSANVGAFNMGHFEQSRSDKTLLDQTNRRPELNRHASRNSATNPEDIVFGPPRMSFTSAGRKGAESDRTREGEPQTRMNNFRSRTGEGDGDRFREGRNANPRRRDGGDDDKESWTTVKPRKSFGAEGAERFQGRMGIIRDDKRTSRETDRPSRGFDTFNREKDNEEDGRPRNGTRHKQEPSEGRIGGEKREQMDRAKSWREKVSNDDAGSSRQGGNHNNRQWGRDGRDGRAEREPEWLDEPADPKPQQPKTQGDFAKWKAEMHAAETAREARASGSTATKPVETAAEPAKPPMRSPPADVGNDKFFAAYGASAAVSTPGEDTTSKPAVKSSRFQDFFATRNAPRNEPPPQVQPPPTQAPPPPGLNGLLGALQGAPSGNASQDEKQAFANIIAKLKVQSVSATPPGSTPFAAPPPSQPEGPPQTGSSPFQQMQSPQEGPIGPPPSQHPQELHAPRPQQQTARPDQLMQDLLGHHQRATSQSSGRNQGSRPDAGRNNSNSEFLMNLMRAPDAQRSDSAMKRAAQQAQRQGPMPPQPHEREGDFGEDGRNAQRMRGPPPGFGLDDRFRGEGDFRQPQPQGQPPHILQRPQGPPGLDQMPPGFMGGHMPLPQPQGQQPPRGGPMPPPGLQGGRGILPGMFPPGMPPPGPHMHPEMGNIPGPPRNMGMPPPGFFNGGPPPPGGPHGFMPPGMGGFNGPPGPESPFSAGPHSGGPHSGGPHSAGPFDRGMPQNRGGNFGRN